ncbi:MAG: hypothetical protein P1V51_25250 [Deltaproteobacteria bacterium]|nr:hypothetical protein [Deltaproteobacteria bacterium]
MAETCRDEIQAWSGPQPDLPPSLGLHHLVWMCREIEIHAGTWPLARLHRWFGFIQAGMIANYLLGLEGAKRQFDTTKNSHPAGARGADARDPDLPLTLGEAWQQLVLLSEKEPFFPQGRAMNRELEKSEAEPLHDSVPLILAMAEYCRDTIDGWDSPRPDLPTSLALEHLDWMCGQIKNHSGTWPLAKLHRWIGFIQAGMVANGLVRLEGVKRMFDRAKLAHPALDQDLLDHLDGESPFELDIGGSG